MPILQRQMEEEMRQTVERLASEERALREKCKRGKGWDNRRGDNRRVFLAHSSTR